MELRVQAKFVVASPDRILSPGQIVVCDGIIQEVTGNLTCQPDLDLGESVVIAGFVNAHCHLEFSDFETPIPPGMSFPDWISSVVRHRRGLANEFSAEELKEYQLATLNRGLQEASAHGTAVVGDIVSIPWQPGDHTARRERVPAAETTGALVEQAQVLAMPEFIGLTNERFQATIDWATQALAQHKATASSDLVDLGISPHAPYSLPLEALVDVLSKGEFRRLTAIHVAESREELEYLRTGSGPFRDSFERLGLPIPSKLPSISDFIQILGNCPRGLLVHGNYLSPSEISQLAGMENVTVAYCPRTHSHFGHDEYPLQAYLNAGVNVVLGTDSRASNPDLDLWGEVVEARKNHAGLSPSSAVSMVTTEAAKSLGVSKHFGDIAPGKVAFLNVAATRTDWSFNRLLDAITMEKVDWRPLGNQTYQK